MASNFKLNSFIHRFLAESESFGKTLLPSGQAEWGQFLAGLKFSQTGGHITIAWRYPSAGAATYSLDRVELYLRGDSQRYSLRQKDRGLVDRADVIREKNQVYFHDVLKDIVDRAGLNMQGGNHSVSARLEAEARFHDEWAHSENPASINVRKMNEACTAPEMRFIVRRLGNLQGKRLLDVGCGLGEASVYFALLGAKVTSLDLSAGMLQATKALAEANGVQVHLHQAAAENLGLSSSETFDVIYAGNLLHHVDIEQTLNRLWPHLGRDGMLVTWDPLAYNPAINVYRQMAKDVRTPDEHPLTLGDLRLVRRLFMNVETHYFWFATLVIFVVMALVQRRDPNKQRFWKVVVEEGEKWRWLYAPLERIDRFLLTVFPPLRLLCWNVVIFATAPAVKGELSNEKS